MKIRIKLLCLILASFFVSGVTVNAKLLCTYDHVTINVDGDVIEKNSTKRGMVTGEFSVNNFKDSNGIEKCPSKIYCKDNGSYVDMVSCYPVQKQYHDEVLLTKEEKGALNIKCDYDGDVIEVKNDAVILNGGKGTTDLTILDFYDNSNAIKCPERVYCLDTSDANGKTIRSCSKRYDSKAESKNDPQQTFSHLQPMGLGKLTCDTVFKNPNGSYNQFYYLVWNVLKVMKYAAIALTLGLSIMDYIKVITSGDKEALQKTTTKCIKRLIVGVVIFFIPYILKYALNIIGEFTTCDLL